MTNIIHFEPLTTNNYQTYIEVGMKAYNEHYLHLWPNGDSTSYLKSSFTNKVLEKEALDTNTLLFLIYNKNSPLGILKITQNKSLGNYSSEHALYVDKIYMLKEATGNGIGRKAIQFIVLRAKELGKKIIWLDTMQKGPALSFYLKNGFEIYGETRLQFDKAIESEKPMYILVREI